jgi:hypothetical protein
VSTDLSVMRAKAVQAMRRWLMHSVLWASILASAGVALVTTLLVEYLARPWLEVRKDRIVEKGRQRRDAINKFRRALNLANKFLAYKGQPSEVFNLMNDQIRRNMTEMQEYMLTAFEFIDVPESVSREWEYTATSIHSHSIIPPAMLANMPDEFWEGFEDTFQRMKDFHKLFKTSKRHPWRRHKLIRDIKASPAPISFKSQKERDSLPG